MARPASLHWFARHELTLIWRDWLSMMTAGRPRRARAVAIVVTALAAGFHFIAAAMLYPWIESGATPDKTVFVFLGGSAALAFSLMLSQAMETITRAYYSRADLDLILSSPADSRRVFAVRTSAAALAVAVMPALLASPFVNMLVVYDGAHWLGIYAVLIALGALATALAVIITVALFRTVGAKQARLMAQILAAIVGAAFVIGLQVAAILYYGSLSRLTLFQSPEFVAWFPDTESVAWLPARAAMGDSGALIVVLAIGLSALAAVVAISSRSFGRLAVAAIGVSEGRDRRQRHDRAFVGASVRMSLLRKEWTLLARDPWLISQSLMQILYLLPPALMLWLNYRDTVDALAIVIPVIVMASGQLAGALAWLAISGEDAPDLVATAPLGANTVLVTKVEAVLSLILIIVAPLLILIAVVSPTAAIFAAIGIALAAASATAIQLWFKVQASRAMFRRRQVSSKTATFAEAAASILWAAATGLIVAGSAFAPAVILIALCVLAFVRWIRPAEEAVA